ncbi:Protein N-terminal glutamine amidohydrolase [Linum grandiflorum]
MAEREHQIQKLQSDRVSVELRGRSAKMATEDSEATRSSSVTVSEFVYTPYYCEENVYFLCKKLCENGKANEDGSDLYVVFISNEKKQVPLWNQKASTRADGIVLWDYHVICIQKKRDDDSSSALIWDLDSSLPFPSPLATYLSETMRPSFELFSDFQRLYRVVHAPVFLREFASDRRHMKDSTGNWINAPPSYEPIVAEDGSIHNLNEYMDIKAPTEATTTDELIDMAASQGRKRGVIIKEAQLEDFFSK